MPCFLAGASEWPRRVMTWQPTGGYRDLGADQEGPSAVKREWHLQNKRVLPQGHRGTRGGRGERLASRHRIREDCTPSAGREEGENVLPD